MNKKVIRLCENCGEQFSRIGRHTWCKDCDTPYFIKRAIKVHGHRYDYRYTNYSSALDKVKIICPEHGIFEQQPSSHLQGQGCPACFQLRPYTNEEFIQKAIKIHGNRFDYKHVNYVNARTKVKIICPVHGVFEQTPFSHFQGNGCHSCSPLKPSNTNEFIKKATKIHKNRFDYQLVDYSNSLTKVKIVCPDHGIFEQVPSYHLSGNGCPSCSKSKPLTTEIFIEKAVKVHGTRYDYKKVNYINSQTKVTIICQFHGSFKQTPSKHLWGQGCGACRGRFQQ